MTVCHKDIYIKQITKMKAMVFPTDMDGREKVWGGKKEK